MTGIGKITNKSLPTDSLTIRERIQQIITLFGGENDSKLNPKKQ